MNHTGSCLNFFNSLLTLTLAKRRQKKDFNLNNNKWKDLVQ